LQFLCQVASLEISGYTLVHTQHSQFPSHIIRYYITSNNETMLQHNLRASK